MRRTGRQNPEKVAALHVMEREGATAQEIIAKLGVGYEFIKRHSLAITAPLPAFAESVLLHLVNDAVYYMDDADDGKSKRTKFSRRMIADAFGMPKEGMDDTFQRLLGCFAIHPIGTFKSGDDAFGLCLLAEFRFPKSRVVKRTDQEREIKGAGIRYSGLREARAKAKVERERVKAALRRIGGAGTPREIRAALPKADNPIPHKAMNNALSALKYQGIVAIVGKGGNRGGNTWRLTQ